MRLFGLAPLRSFASISAQLSPCYKSFISTTIHQKSIPRQAFDFSFPTLRLAASNYLLGLSSFKPMYGNRRSLSETALPDKKEAAKEEKPKYKGRNLFDILAYLDNFGVGWRVSRNPWIRKYPDSYWIVTRVKLFPSRRVWGKKVWKGQLMFEGAERRIKSVAKREWRYLCKDPNADALNNKKPSPKTSVQEAPVPELQANKIPANSSAQ